MGKRNCYEYFLQVASSSNLINLSIPGWGGGRKAQTCNTSEILLHDSWIPELMLLLLSPLCFDQLVFRLRQFRNTTKIYDPGAVIVQESAPHKESVLQ